MRTKPKYMSSYDIIEQYKDGKKDFSNIVCCHQNFMGINLQGIIFRKSNLNGSSFRECNLSEADFSRCGLEWCSFKYSKLKNAKFIGVNAVNAIFSLAELEKTDFSKADLTYALFIGCERFEGKFDDAILDNIIWDVSEVSCITLENRIRRAQEFGFPLERLMNVFRNIKIFKEHVFNLADLKDERKSPIYDPSVTNAPAQKDGTYGGVKTYGGAPAEGTYAASASGKAYGAVKQKKK